MKALAPYPLNKFNILMTGHFNGLQGLEIVAKAILKVRKSKRVFFTIIGDGFEVPLAKKILKHNEQNNFRFIKSVKKEKYLEYIQCADLILAGNFVDTEKGKSVIRNSTIEALACAKLILIPDTPANKELGLKDGFNCYMCKIGDPVDLARKINEITKLGGGYIVIFEKGLK